MKGSPSTRNDQASEEIVLMQAQLAKLGKLPKNPTAERIRAAFVEHRAEQDTAREHQAEMRRRELEAAKRATLRRSVESAGIDVVGMSDAQLEQEHDRLLAEAAARRADRDRQHAMAQRRAAAERLFRAAGCPDLHVHHLDRCGANDRWLQIRDLLVERAMDAQGYLVSLMGLRGTGKSQLAVSVIHRCTERLLTCRYTTAQDLFRDMRRAYTPTARGQAGVSEQELFDRWAAFDMLVIDETHQRNETAAEQNLLIGLIDRRYANRRCTILISNQTREQFAGAMGDSVISRLHESGAVIECTWPTFRRPGQWTDRPAERRVPSGDPVLNGGDRRIR